ncbi:MAG: Piwi domain-containing protein, partial [Nostoc sp.]
QKLSLSLDENFKSNKNFYIDKCQKISTFISNSLVLDNLFPIKGITHTDIDIEKKLYQLKANTLNSKTYIFKDEKEGQSPYKGISDYGPLKSLTDKAHFYFAFTDEARDYAVDLYKALRGQLHSTTFPGLSQIFKISIEKENTSRSSVKKFDSDSVKQMMAEIKTGNHNYAIQIAILNSRMEKQDYYNLKHGFLKETIPLQIITLDLLKNKEAFKWSVSNIALQIFAKLGGKPWKVKPSNQNCLTIGIGQSHKLTKTLEGQTIVDKYFAYSVLIDSSGLYKDIEILGNSEDEERYTKQIHTKIQNIVKQYNSEYRKFVIHTPFKLKNKELLTIQNALQNLSQDEELKDIELVVIKINSNNKFFGYYYQANSLVPYESTFLQISRQEFLIWLEGIQSSRPNVYKRFSGPTHIQFYYSNKELSNSEKIKYLQDLINLSGANWRGFNAKLLPVSVYYCQLIAKRIKEFHSLGYSDIQIKDSNPWFL